ncbi:MAG: hypothetical protein ACRDCE_20395 [Cetobacterium sp.]|uniref:hypothetical protein n=1 Tax=Cetobacterium sp. TaxID=2071632 RepID=UPI003EE4CDDA
MFKKIAAAAIIAVTTMTVGVATAKADANVWANTYTDYTYQGGLKGNPIEQFKKHNATVGVEGGLSTGFLDAYAFSEYNASLDTQFTKANGHMDVWKDVSIYGQWSDFNDGTDFNESQYTVGVGYTGLSGSGYALKPFVGANLTINQFEEVWRPMVGWNGFMVLPEGAMLTHWNESRVIDSKVTANGAVGLFQDVTKSMYVGAQYRYFYNDAGVKGFGDALMLRVGFHL